MIRYLATLALLLPLGLACAEDKPIVLFNGKDLSNFYTYLQKHGKNTDPNKVFSVVMEDGRPAIRVSGQDWGGFVTEKEFENFKLIAEFKWGKLTFAPRQKNTRDSGILVHCIGEDGGSSAKGDGPWMESIEYQIIEGGTGDFIVVSGKGKRPKITATIEYKETGPQGKTRKEAYFKDGGEKKEFTSGRVNWWGRDPLWKDELGFRGKNDVEKPVGEWNTIECICAGDTITNILNGKVVNKATNVTPTKGKILFQSEGAELFFRRIELVPLKK